MINLPGLLRSSAKPSTRKPTLDDLEGTKGSDPIGSGSSTLPVTLDDLEGEPMGGSLPVPADAQQVLRSSGANDPTGGGGPGTYQVKPGDTFFKIAQRTLGSGARWKEIWELNKGAVPNPNLLYPGTTLRLPGGSNSQPSAPTSKPSGGSGGSGPTLRQGMKGDAVKQLQQRLAQLGCDPGGADGDFGPKTLAAVKKFQRQSGITADGIVGPQTWGKLGITVNGGVSNATPQNSAQGNSVRNRLLAHLHGAYWQVVHQCFRYSWNLVAASGGKGIGSAPRTTAGRGNGIGYLNTLISNGTLHVGDVIYVNRHPGADPSSTNLAYGPHWFTYIGNGQFADQYGQRDANAMQSFVPGRVIDTIYHPF
jgi:peptidoglycan hydrolase-like protein with peptidoglycan-binding domain